MANMTEEKSPKFFIVFKDIKPLLHKDFRAGKTAALFWRTFMYICSQMSSNNHVKITIAELKEGLGDSIISLKRVLKELKESNLLAATGKRSSYTVNPRFVIKQKIDHREQLIAMYDNIARRSREMQSSKLAAIEVKLNKVLDNQEAMQKQIAAILASEKLSQKEKNEKILKLVK